MPHQGEIAQYLSLSQGRPCRLSDVIVPLLITECAMTRASEKRILRSEYERHEPF
jgi:hypothetical protein